MNNTETLVIHPGQQTRVSEIKKAMVTLNSPSWTTSLTGRW